MGALFRWSAIQEYGEFVPWQTALNSILYGPFLQKEEKYG